MGSPNAQASSDQSWWNRPAWAQNGNSPMVPYNQNALQPYSGTATRPDPGNSPGSPMNPNNNQTFGAPPPPMPGYGSTFTGWAPSSGAAPTFNGWYSSSSGAPSGANAFAPNAFAPPPMPGGKSSGGSGGPTGAMASGAMGSGSLMQSINAANQAAGGAQNPPWTAGSFGSPFGPPASGTTSGPPSSVNAFAPPPGYGGSPAGGNPFNNVNYATNAFLGYGGVPNAPQILDQRYYQQYGPGGYTGPWTANG